MRGFIPTPHKGQRPLTLIGSQETQFFAYVENPENEPYKKQTIVCVLIIIMDLSKFSKKRIYVAVSGGVDSIALLHFLSRQAQVFEYQLFAVHCEHGIRGAESLRDKAFVEKVCKEWQIPLVFYAEDCVKKAAIEKCSLETAARNFRYACFSLLIKENKADFIATAHHKNDEAETILFRLARGTSLTGARGMQSSYDWLLRPFLDWSREEIERYARENNLSYCVDSTNLERDATRNKIRLDILPKLEECVPGATSNLAHFATLAAEDDELLYEYSQALLSKKQEGYLITSSNKKPLFTRACLTAMKGLGLEKDYTAKHLDAVFALQQAERGAWLCLPKNIIAEKQENGIVLKEKQQEFFEKKSAEEKFSLDGFDGGRYALRLFDRPVSDENNDWKTLKIDVEKLPADAVFRFRKEGDKISVFGGGTKTLKKFFNEKKLLVQEREYLPLIADKNSDAVYVIGGVEIADSVKVSEKTKKIIYIQLQMKE